MVDGYDASVLGKQFIIITYGGVSVTVQVNVQKRIAHERMTVTIVDSKTNEKMSDVTVTLYWIESDGSSTSFDEAPADDNYGMPWNIEDWEQTNDSISNSDGSYSWSIPDGWWRVKCEKDGYETVWSDWISVPPSRTDVSIAMTPIAKPVIILGDANGDGVVNSADSSTILRRLAGWSIAIDSVAADVNGDGVVDSKDAALISRKISGWDASFS